MRTTHLIAPTLLLCAASVAWSAQDADPVPVRDFNVVPFSNSVTDGISIHPKALVGLGWNSNLNAADRNGSDAVKDYSKRVSAGANLAWTYAKSLSASLDAEYDANLYTSDNEGYNLKGGRALANVGYKGSSNEAGLNGGYERINDPLIQTGESLLRQTYSAGANDTWTGSSILIGGNVNWGYTDYLEDSAAGTHLDETRDITETKGALRVGYILGASATIYAKVTGIISDYKDNTLATSYNDSKGYGHAIGVESKVGEKASVLAEIGADHRKYDQQALAFSDDKTDAVTGVAAFIWPWETGSNLSLRGFRTVDNSLSSNAMVITGGTASVRYRVLQKAALLAGVGYVDLLDQGALPGLERNHRRSVNYDLGAEYALREGIAVRVTGRYTKSDALGGSDTLDYDRFEAATELAFVY